jgi:hypothetical protein
MAETGTIKVLIVGARYTGKGQIGRAWGQTDADLPALQPVILYDRYVDKNGTQLRVVAWVLSYDPEFEGIRTGLFAGADAVVYTASLVEEHVGSIDRLDDYEAELGHVLGWSPPAVVAGTVLSTEKPCDESIEERVIAWAGEHGDLPYFHLDYTDRQQFSTDVRAMFMNLLGRL